MTGSACLNLLAKLYAAAEGWYEQSACRKLAGRASRWVENSFFYRLACVESPRTYAGGSLFFRLLYGIFGFFAAIAGKISVLFWNMMEASACRKIFSASVLSKLRLEALLAAFLFVMSVVPANRWNNMYILFAAVFFTFVYVFQVCAGLRKGLSIRQVSPALIAFAILALLSLFQSYRPMDSLRIILISGSAIALSLVIQATVVTKKQLQAFIIVLLCGVFVSSLFGLAQYAMGLEVREDFVDLTYSAGLRRLFATMDNPNNYAEYLIMLLPFSAAAILTAKTDAARLLLSAMAAPCVLALFLTGSRSSYIAVAAAAGIYVLIVNKRLLPFFMLLFIASMPFWPGFVVERIMTIGRDSSSSYRLLIWAGVRDLLRHNWFAGLGIGPDTFTNSYRVIADYRAATAMHSHNLFLQIWIEMGLPALLTFILFIANTVKAALARAAACVNRADRHMLAAFLAALTGVVLMGMVEYVWFYPRVALTFWVIIGLGAAAVRISRDEHGVAA